MAESYSHKFGQVIGEVLELAIEPYLMEFADKNLLFLDKKGSRIARRGKKLSWVDGKNNKHDLDFVLEKGGTPSKLGKPVAFIETAWRRYTKHSRNKAQEIQGAIVPLLEKYNSVSPYAGVVLAGDFTSNSLTQLRSHGFGVLHFSYASVIKAFQDCGIDARFDEKTEEQEFKSKLTAVEELGNKHSIARQLMALNKEDVELFLSQLEQAVSRHVESIRIWPLYGSCFELKTLKDAIEFVDNYIEGEKGQPFVRYEISIKYNTGTVINAVCVSKREASLFLSHHATR